MDRRGFLIAGAGFVGGLILPEVVVGREGIFRGDRLRKRRLILPSELGFNSVKKLVKKSAKQIALEEVIHRDYSVGEVKAIRDNKYLVDKLSSRDDLDFLKLNKLEQNRLALKERLEQLEHPIYVWNYPKHIVYNEGIGGAFRLSPRQFARVYLNVEALEDSNYRKKLGELIEKDLVKNTPEVGGIELLDDKGKLFVQDFDSDEKQVMNYVERLKRHGIIVDINNLYSFPEEVKRLPNIGEFHTHTDSEEDSDEKNAGPSYWNGPPEEHNGDIGNELLNARFNGESHSFVFTKLYGKNFNVTYYGGEKKSRPVLTVLSLGNWNYG